MTVAVEENPHSWQACHARKDRENVPEDMSHEELAKMRFLNPSMEFVGPERPKFRFVPYVGDDFPENATLPINSNTIDVDTTTRWQAFLQRLRKFGEQVEREFPSDIQVSYSVAPWGGEMAIDRAEIKSFDDQGNEVRRIEVERNLGICGPDGIIKMLLPQPLEDKWFFEWVRFRAELLSLTSRFF